jgi:hypothetical protein
VQTGKLQKIAGNPLSRTKVFVAVGRLAIVTSASGTISCCIATAQVIARRIAVINITVFAASSAAFRASVARRASFEVEKSFACWVGTQF